MCTRFTFHEPDKAIAAIAAALAREIALPPEPLRARWNATLTHVMPVVSASTDGPELRGMVWGLVPAYARSQPLPSDRMQEREVSRYVSNSRNEGPACHATPEAEPPELALG